MSSPDPEPHQPASPAGAELHRRRQQVTWRTVGAGAVLAVLATVATGVAGGTGRAGMVILLSVLALTTGVAGLWSTVTLLVDDLRKRGTTRARIVTSIGLFVATGMLMAMVVGAGTA